MSHSVKELENHTGVRLLDRTTREVVLTDAGQQLALRLERLLDELNSTLRDTGRMGQQLSGKVRVAASQTISAHLIPQCIAESHRRYPDIQFVLHDRPQQWVMESIRQGRCRLWHRHRSRAQWAICNVKRFFPSLSFCFAIAIALWPSKIMYHWQALQGAKLVLQDYASGSRPLIDAALARNGIQANIVQEIGHPATLFPMVAAGIGISILPALALPLPEGSPLVVKRITPVVERQLMLVRRKNRSLSTAAEALWDVVRDQGNALMAGREGDPLYQI